MSRPLLVALLLALITLVIYLPVTRCDFVHYDDDDYVVDNRIVQNGLTWTGVKWAFTTGSACNWHPVTWLSHMTDCELFNLNAGAHHFVNALIHSANAAFLFILLLRLTQKPWPAALVAALFAWHPLHVESVAWVAERKDVLSTFFALLALLSYTRYAQERSGVESQKSGVSVEWRAFGHRQSSPAYFLALLFFALGLMSKPMLVTLPFILLLLDFWPLQRTTRDGWMVRGVQLVIEKLPFFLLTAASCIITLFVQHKSMASLGQIPLTYRLENAPSATIRYLLKIFWPADLAVIYPLAWIPGAFVVLAMIALLLISAAAWHWRKIRPYFLVGWLWFLGTLVPVIGLVQVGSASMADRYAYIPSVGIFVATVFGLDELAAKQKWAKKLFPFGMILLLSLCVMLTEKQLGYWRDSETLFRHALAITKDNDVAHDNLGFALELQGRSEEALAEYRKALQIRPSYHQLHFSIGNMLNKLGHPTEALAEYRLCLSFDPEVPALHNAAGDSLVALGKLDEALAEFSRAAQLDPHYAAPHVGRAKALLLQDRDHEAIAELRIALQIDPDDFKILAYTAHILAADENPAARDGSNALTFALKANELTFGSQPLVLDILGMAYAETGDFNNAMTCAQNALELAGAAKLENREAMRHRLELYKNHQPWREFFNTHASMKD